MWNLKLRLCYLKNSLWLLSLVTLACSNLIQQEPENPAKELMKAQGRDISGKVFTETPLHAFNSWNRRCETRLGNLIADAIKERGETQIGIMNGGGIRPLVPGDANNLAVNTLPKGEVTRDQVTLTILPFPNKLTVIRLRGYRLKQMLEHSAAAITTTVTVTASDDHDADGATHGDCRANGSTGGGATASGGFLHFSKGFKVYYKPSNERRETNGQTGLNTQLTTQGKRVVKIVLNNAVIYDNPGGDMGVGWVSGTSSCALGTTNFTNSMACTYFTLAVSDFYVNSGGDNYSMLAPTSAEVNNDGSVQIEKTTGLIIGELVWDYLTHLNSSAIPIKPVIEGRITYE